MLQAAAGGLQSVQLWNGAEAGSTHGQFRKPRHAQPNWIGASSTLGREVALDSGSRTIQEVLSEEGQHRPQRERFDDETVRVSRGQKWPRSPSGSRTGGWTRTSR